MWHCHKDRQRDQWNKAETPQINSHMYAPVIFDKDAKTIQWGEVLSCQQMVLGKVDIHR